MITSNTDSMKQQELIHIHALLFEVGEYVTPEDTIAADELARYEAQPTRPHHIHRGKNAHQTAINHLLRGCTQLVRTSHHHTQTVSTETTPS